MEHTEIADAYCGLYCGACPTFLQTKVAVANGEDVAGKDCYCLGCKSSLVSGWCATCSLKDCVRQKSLDSCAGCNDYPCAQIKGFIETAEYKYHIETPYYIALIRKEGKQSWLDQMKKRWTCSNCSTSQSWYAKTCSSCGKELYGYDQKK